MDFKIYKTKHNLTNAAIAKRLGISRDYFSAVLNGFYIPSGKLMKRIIDLTQAEVTSDSFFREQIDKWKKPAHIDQSSTPSAPSLSQTHPEVSNG